MRKRGIACAGLLVGVSILAFSLPASATTTYPDNYWGGLNTYSNSDPNNSGAGDIIGNSNFEIYSADVTRNGNNLSVTINTNFVQHIGEDGVGLGALFLTNNTPTWNTDAQSQSAPYNGSNGSGPPTYSYDVAQNDPGRFSWAVQLPGSVYDPSTVFNGSGQSGTVNLLALASGASAGTDVVYSNAGGTSTTYPLSGSGNYYFRQGQAVGTTSTTDVGDVQWSIGNGTLTFDIANAFVAGGGVLQDTFYLAWAMTCANDVIYVNPTLAAQGTTPLPASLPLFLGGAGLMGWAARKRRRTSKQMAT